MHIYVINSSRVSVERSMKHHFMRRKKYSDLTAELKNNNKKTTPPPSKPQNIMHNYRELKSQENEALHEVIFNAVHLIGDKVSNSHITTQTP